MRPESFPEITHNGWREWDDNTPSVVTVGNMLLLMLEIFW